ncbi:hypothetical protein Ga0466249_002586 [Sporomusaceae bacterium BoRhaA]|jgi:hypothetical protein|uniref:hypothetical protein n=1 Tax=Pelorhabdus rhamnosifermentans TaxID=2772457 RepID=UPI001C064163|nr:hypothetical protein [Pelorhabdus rhamnosifermentans]MBU2701470.1 hypothetical protein [Pelorhabdus rhamnosifermentans]
MYKLIIGTVRVTVTDDNMSREQAATLAKQAIAKASSHNKLLSHVEISSNEDAEPEVKATEKAGCKLMRKSIKQSIIDTIEAAVQEKVCPSGAFVNRELWYDNDTGQEWRGAEVDTARSEIYAKFDSWLKTL